MQGGKCCYVVCQGLVPPCGRPLHGDDDVPRVAPMIRLANSAVADAPNEARDRWLADAAMEHASIASFARFVLELEKVGAPARLVHAARRAGLDEIEHTRLCLAMASCCDGGRATFVPGELALDGITIRDRLDLVAAAAADEACVGETYSTLAAWRRYDEETDAVARKTLAQIAFDEARHAELGWTFVAWSIAQGGESIAAAVSAAVERSLARLGHDAAANDARAIVRDALRLVVHVDTARVPSLDRSSSDENSRARV